MRILTPLALTASLVLTLSACGGGSSSSTNPSGSDNSGGDTTNNPADFTPISLNSENAENVAGMAVGLLDLGLQSSDAANGARALNGPKTGLESKAKLFEAPCEEGGSTTFNGGDGDDQIETGDYIELVDDNCATQEIDDDTGESYIDTSNGPLRIDVVRVTSQLDLGYKFSMDQTSSTSHGHSSSIKGSGTFNIKLDGNGGQTGSGSYNMTATYDGKSVTFNPMTYAIDIADDQYTYDYSADIYGSAIQGSISIGTDPSFTGNVENDYPTAGILTVTGSNSSIMLNADTGSIDTVLMTINDNGSISSNEITWESLEDPEPIL